jgi:hypothetical protein
MIPSYIDRKFVDAAVAGSIAGALAIVAVRVLNLIVSVIDIRPDSYPVRACSYQPRVRNTIRTTESMTGTSMSTPTTVASAAPD